MSITRRLLGARTQLPYIFLFVLSLVVFVPIMTAASKRNSDFGIHRVIAEEFPHQATHVSHVLFHAVYRLFRYGLPTVESTDVVLLAIMVFVLPLPMIIFSLSVKYCVGLVSVYAILFLSVGLTIASPITIWTNEWMIGYINPLVYHSPTLIALRPFTIPLSLLALRIFSNTAYRNANHRLYTLLLCASLLLLSTLAKQSYTMVLIPGCCAFAAWKAFRGNRVDWILLVFGICIPGSLMLGLQYLLSFVHYADGSGISFGIFVFMRYWIPYWRIPIQFLLSLAFPLTVYLLFFSEARKHLYLNLSWTIFVTGALMTYCLYESGFRIDHGNFIWNSYISVFVLMFASLTFLYQRVANARSARLDDDHRSPRRTSLKFCISFVMFGSHVFFGIGYYMRFLTGFVY